MLAHSWSVALTGINGQIVRIEADIAQGLPATTVIGLGDTAVNQAKERVRAAILNSGCKWPDRRITLALSPAGLPKRGAGYDLALAAAVLAADDQLPERETERLLLIGELGLDGRVLPIRGILPSLLTAAHQGWTAAVVPTANLGEALLSGLRVRAARNLADLVDYLRGDADNLASATDSEPTPLPEPPDLADVLGQPEARLGLELAAAGGHHLAMIGPPGAGKTMLAARMPGILPRLPRAAALEVTAVHSVAGLLDDSTPLLDRPPFVDPHHSASLAAIVGGGSGTPRPGCVSLAHHGVLFLDEAPEFRMSVLDALRQPMESGSVLLARSSGAVRYPASFQLVLAANPCPCAAARDVDCSCDPGARRRYLGRLSGPLLDRVDIRLDLPALTPAALTAHCGAVEASSPVRARVTAARERAAARWRSHGWSCNAQVPGPAIRRSLRLPAPATRTLEDAARQGRLTARGYDRVLRLALTCADLAGRDSPDGDDVALALALRCGEAA